MKPFGKIAKTAAPAVNHTDVIAAIRELSDRFERIERAVRDLKQNVDLVPAIVRKMYLADVKLDPPYDLQAERFSFSSQNDEDGLVLALVKRIGSTNRRFVELGCGCGRFERGASRIAVLIMGHPGAASECGTSVPAPVWGRSAAGSAC